MTITKWLAISTLCVATDASEAQVTNASALRQEIEALLTDMVSAFKADPASVSKYYTDDAMILGGNAHAVGREQVDQYWRGAMMFADWKLDVLDVGDGQRPWVRGRSTLIGRSGRTMVTEFIGLLARDPDGRLRFAVDMYVAARRP